MTRRRYLQVQCALHKVDCALQNLTPLACDELRKWLGIEAGSCEAKAAIHAVGSQLDSRLADIELLLLHWVAAVLHAGLDRSPLLN